jgi:hypothetical protein
VREPEFAGVTRIGLHEAVAEGAGALTELDVVVSVGAGVVAGAAVSGVVVAGAAGAGCGDVEVLTLVSAVDALASRAPPIATGAPIVSSTTGGVRAAPCALGAGGRTLYVFETTETRAILEVCGVVPAGCDGRAGIGLRPRAGRSAGVACIGAGIANEGNANSGTVSSGSGATAFVAGDASACTTGPP